MAADSTRPNAARAGTAGQDHDALYDGPPLVPVSQLAPGARWVAIAAARAEAVALAQGLPAPGGQPAEAIGLDEAGWRASVALLDGDSAVAVVAGTPGLAVLPALRLLETHRGVVLLLDREGAGDIPASVGAYRLAHRSGGALVLVDAGGPALAHVRRPRVAPARASVGRRWRRLARLAQPGARVAAVGAAGLTALGGSRWPALVDHDAVDGWEPTWAERGAPGPDVVLLDSGAPSAGAVRDAAAAHNIRVVEPLATPVIEPTEDNPIGFIREPAEGVLAIAGDAEPPSNALDHQAVRIDPAGAAAPTVARLVVRLAARGLPVLLSPGLEEVTGLLGAGVRTALEHAAQIDLDDPDARERASIALRRAALAEHSADIAARDVVRRAGLTPRPWPAVSVLLATRRPDFLAHALAQVGKQRYPALEVVVVAHAPGVAEAAREQLASRDLDHAVVDVEPDKPFGAALDAGVAAAGGQVLAKMDDDDWYGPHHVADCVAALRYSGAPLVGKGAEFCWLAAAGRTVRRSSRNAERYHTVVSGASLTIARDDLADLGGWAHQSRAVDRRLIDAVERSGERTYRLHSLEFCVNRHEEGNTWTAGTDYFLRQTEAQWSGRALEAAGIDG